MGFFLKYLLFALFLSTNCQIWAVSPLQVVNLTCEYQKNPLGIDDLHPCFCWNFVATERNQNQSAYEIIVFENNLKVKNIGGESSPQAKSIIWQTGKITSNNNLHIEYDGPALNSFTTYFWQVKVYNQANIASNWSENATFETAVLQESDWQAKWIDDGRLQFEKEEDFYKDDPNPLFRKQIIINKKIIAARLYIAGLGYHEAYLNSEKIGNHLLDPAFLSYQKQVPYVTHDLTNLLKKGINTFGFMLGNGWYNPLPLRLFGKFNLREHQQTGRPCLKAQILIKYADGSQEIIATDANWQTAQGPILRNNVYLGEQYDARLEKNFNIPNGWKNASLTAGPKGILVSQKLPPIRVTKIIKPVGIRKIGHDTFIIDMGQNFSGVARIHVRGKAGTRISMRYGEDTLANGALNYLTTVAGQIKEIWQVNGGPGAPKTAWQQDIFTLNGVGEEQWNARFTFHGFRYVELTGWPGTPTLDDIEGLRMNTDVATSGAFHCSNPMFNQLHEVVNWTFLSNIFSVQSDCPGREKMGYGGDLVATSEAFIYNFDMANFYTKTVQDFANDQELDGGITETAPYMGISDRGYGGRSGPLGWQLAFPYLQRQLYDYYGDKRIISQHYPAFKRQMDFLETKAINGLFHWDISDHEALDPKPEAFTAAAFYYHHALLAKEFAEILDKKEDFEHFSQLSKNIKEAIVQKYLIPKTGRFDNATQAAQIFALWYGFSPEKAATLAVLKQEFERHKGHLSTGIFATKMMFDVLRKNDQNELAYQIANQKDFPSWGYMLAKGATTLWETWAYSDNVYSQNHPMFGSVDEWFYKSLLGINAAAPGFQKIIIKPQPAGLTSADGFYESVSGKIACAWKIEKNTFLMNVEIPPNTTAEIWIPSLENAKITKNNHTIDQIMRFEKGYVVLQIGSGIYEFKSVY
jgi:alpha-L-rhamnosidase